MPSRPIDKVFRNTFQSRQICHKTSRIFDGRNSEPRITAPTAPYICDQKGSEISRTWSGVSQIGSTFEWRKINWTDSQESSAWMISRAQAGEQRKLIRRSAGTSALLKRRLTTLRGALLGRVLLPARERFRRSSGCMRIGRCCASMSYVESIRLFGSNLP